MRSILIALSMVGLALAAACAPQAPTEIAWRHDDVEAAFQEAAETGKPVLLYWGAQWCPPCNRLKATLFQDAAFVRQTQDFVPVYLDGDSRGAQLWGEQFAIVGYPTLIILRPDRTEITRLSGGGDPEEISQALAAARQSQSSVAELIARAQTQPRRLSADDWTLVSGYGWEVDTNRIVPAEERGAVLQRLAANAPSPALQRRFELLALTEVEGDLPAAQRTRLHDVLAGVLASDAEVRANRDVLIYEGADLTAQIADDTRAPLQASLIAALDRLYAVEDLPISDRVSTLYPEIAIARANAGEGAPLPQALLAKVRARAVWADQTAQTPYERQSAISDAADLLVEAGDLDTAERLLVAELDRSATAFYYMPTLADIAEKKGDPTRALDWLRRGAETSVGPASRVQWGVSYATGVTRLAPTDKAQVEHAATQVIDEIAASPDSFHQRTRVRFTRLETALRAWAGANNGADVLQRLHAHMVTVCPSTQTSDEAREACAAWLSTTV